MVAALLLFGQQTSAQTLSLSLLERYLESLRVEAGIPGMSVSVLHEGVTVWERGFGRQDLEAAIAATPSTPYAIGALSQIIGSTLLLRKCVEEGTVELFDPVTRWAPDFPEPFTTVREVLTHAAPGIGFSYNPSRVGSLTSLVEACSGRPYTQTLVEEIFEPRGMADSVPATALEALTPRDTAALGPGRIGHHASILARLAVPYRVDPRSFSTTRTAVPPIAATASAGIVTTVRDLARFDSALDVSGLLLLAETRRLAWTQATPLPTGLGWFVQAYNGEPIVWQFGTVNDAYSSLILKAPNRRVTVIMLANSDGLTAPFALERGDVTASLFARLFLRLLVV